MVRHEVIRDAEGPMEACQILFGDEAQTRYDEYLSSGQAVNPARDLGPRIMHALLPLPGGKRDSDWGYAQIPVAGPLIGGVLAGLLYLALANPANVNFR